MTSALGGGLSQLDKIKFGRSSNTKFHQNPLEMEHRDRSDLLTTRSLCALRACNARNYEYLRISKINPGHNIASGVRFIELQYLQCAKLAVYSIYIRDSLNFYKLSPLHRTVDVIRTALKCDATQLTGYCMLKTDEWEYLS